jgi:signal transduction histidine kinase
VTLPTGVETLVCDVASVAGHEQEPGNGQRLVAVFQRMPAGGKDREPRLEALMSLAQEVQSPITTVNNYADLLLSESVGTLGDSQRKFLTRIKSNAERMKQMTDDLFSDTRKTKELVDPYTELLDMAKLIEATVAGSQSHLEDRELTLELCVDEDLPTIVADPEMLQRVLSNLLSNACLASTVGGRVQLRAVHAPTHPLAEGKPDADGEGYLVVSVTDSGGGLSEEALDRVFDQSRPSQTPPGLGESGAGLALAKIMMEAGGGHLWVQSQEGEGTSFSFAVPVGSAEQHVDPMSGATKS